MDTSVATAPAVLPRPAPAAGIFAASHRALTIGIVTLISLAAFESLAVATAMPTVARSLGGLSLYGIAFGGTIAASVVGMVLAGASADTHGPTRPLWLGVGWFAAGLVVAGTAPAMGVLVLGRTMQGLGSGMFAVAIYVVIGQGYPEALRAKAFAALSAAWVVPSLVGPALAGLLVDHVHWRAVFLLVPVLVLPASLLIRSGLPRRARAASADRGGAGRGSVRTRWAVVAASGAALLHLAGHSDGVAMLALFAVAVVTMAVAARRLLPPATLRLGRGLPTVIALRGVAAGAFFGAEVLIPLMLSDERGLAAATAGIALTVGALGWSSGAWWQSRVERPAPRRLRQGMTAIAAGVALVAGVLVPGAPVLVAYLGWALAGVGMGLV
jgi:MFS family permease